MIIFEKVRFKNFGSFGNAFTEIVLNGSNTTLICGNNGSGKSFAFLDSVTFALFGKPFRKINIPQLANSINSKNCVVEVEFSRGTDKFLIRRGINPRILEIFKNGELINQDAKSLDYQEILETQILKMNYKTFTQVVILGSSSFVPFMQLSAADRRSVIENILDIDIFSTMNVVLKGKILTLKDQLKGLNITLELERSKIQLQKNYISTLSKKNNDDDGAKQERVNELTIKINSIKSNLISRNLSKDLLHDTIQICKRTIKDNNTKIQERTKLVATNTATIEQKQNEINFFKDNCTCPVCTQPIDDKIKKEKVLMNIYELTSLVEEVSTITSSISEVRESIESLDREIQKTQDTVHEVDSAFAEIDSYLREIDRITNTITKSVLKDNIIEETDKLKTLEISYSLIESQKEKHSEDLMYHELVNELLRDGGVKAKIIKYYLPYMNKFINKFLSSMDFYVQFHMDEEFNEQIKSRHRDDFSYMNFSEGEKMRIDLALLLSWREIARIKNSVNCNLLILD